LVKYRAESCCNAGIQRNGGFLQPENPSGLGGFFDAVPDRLNGVGQFVVQCVHHFTHQAVSGRSGMRPSIPKVRGDGVP
jgi:hypothetical protein